VVTLLGLLSATFVLSCSLTGVVTWYARRRGMLDLPGDRHSHTEPTPRGGGAGLVAALALASLPWFHGAFVFPFWLLCSLPGFVVLSLMGWWDDQRPLSVRLRLFVQVLVSSYLLLCFHPNGESMGAVPALMAAFYLLWMTNLYNFMDGSNGMAGFQGVFAGLVLAWLFDRANDYPATVLCLVLAVACLGFLPWNLGRAKVFMGDVASGSLGFAIASLLIYAVFSEAVSVPVAWLVMLVFLCDSTLTLVTRVLRGEQWYNPHKQHLYQQLIVRGWSHARVLSLYQAVNLVVVIPAIAVAVNRPSVAAPVAALTTAAIVIVWLVVRRSIGVNV
jgi:Fuc2NAc and GlcNAc transferase